jgi:hypothetical protein
VQRARPCAMCAARGRGAHDHRSRHAARAARPRLALGASAGSGQGDRREGRRRRWSSSHSVQAGAQRAPRRTVPHAHAALQVANAPRRRTMMR